MGSSRFVPLVIAGFIGLLIGWLIGPDVYEAADALGQRLAQLEARVGEIEAPMRTLQSGLTSIDERTTAIATQVQAIGNPAEAIGQIGTRIDAVSGALAARQRADFEALDQQIAMLSRDLEARFDSLQAAVAVPATGTGAPVPAPRAAEPASVPAAREASADAPASSAAGRVGAISVGQTATFGDKRIVLWRLTPEMADVVVIGSGPSTVAPGASIDLGGGCTATLESITAGTARFAPSGC